MSDDLFNSPVSGGESPTAPRPFRIQRLGSVVRRKWWLLLVFVPTLMALGLGFWFWQPTAYTSRAKMWLPGQLQVKDLAQYVEDLQNFFGTQMEIMQSDELNRRVVRRLNQMQTNAELGSLQLDRKVSPKLVLSQVPRSTMFLLECTSSNANLVEVYLNTLMDEFLLYKKEIFAGASGDVVASISEQVSRQERQLKAEQDKLTQFRSQYNLAQLEEESRGGGNQLARLSDQLSMLRLEIKMLDALAVERNGLGNSTTNSLVTASDLGRILGLTGVGASAVSVDAASVEQQLQLLHARRTELAKVLRPKHPKMIKLGEDIARVESLIGFHRQKNLDQLSSAREAMKIRIESLETTVKELEVIVGHANRRLAEYERIRGELQRQQGVYDRLLALLQGVDLNGSVDRGSMAILERASPRKPIRLHLAQILGVAFVAGLGLSGCVFFAMAFFDDRCDSIGDVLAEFGEEVIGQVPELKELRFRRTNSGAASLLAWDQPQFKEAVRNLRSSLLFRSGDGPPPRVIVVTSSTPEEGKSTIAANLAESLALGGSRVLLVDADLRCGALHEVFGKPVAPGCAEVLQNLAELDSCILPTDVPTLSFLPRGHVIKNTGELFIGRSFDILLEAMRRQYDYVVMDTVPLMAADDAATLAPKADGVLFVVRRCYTSARMAREALNQLYRRGVLVLGLVFNGIDASSRSHLYYKYSQYHVTRDQLQGSVDRI